MLAKGRPGINELARFFAKDELPEARQSIATRIITELKGDEAAMPDSPMKSLGCCASWATSCSRPREVSFARGSDRRFQERSKRLVTHEPLLQFMQSAKTSDENWSGFWCGETSSAPRTSGRCRPSSPDYHLQHFETELYAVAGASAPRASERVRSACCSGFPEVQKNQIAAASTSALRIEERSRFLASIEARVDNPNERMTYFQALHRGRIHARPS